MNAPRSIALGVGRAVRERPPLFVATAVAVTALSIMLPPVVLAVARKPWTYFAFNPWLKSLPGYLVSEAPLSQKLDFLSRVALFWFSADGPYGAPEWGFAVDALDLARMVLTGLLLAAFVCLWLDLRDRRRLGAWGEAARRGGALGAVAGVLGLSTGPCSVMGCGAPVLPVVGLAFAGLSSGTLAFLSGLSRVMAVVVVVGLSLAVAVLGLRAGRSRPANQ